jgi:hypothetical protein
MWTRPPLSTSASRSLSAPTKPSRVDTAEVSWPFTLTFDPSVPRSASTRSSWVPGNPSSPSWVSAADSPSPHPGLKYARLLVTGNLVTAPFCRSTTAVKPPRPLSSALLVKLRGA